MSTENSELMMHHYLDLDSASDWSCCMGNLRQLINQKHYTDLGSDSHQYGIFALGGETRGGHTKCWLFCQGASLLYILKKML